VLWFYALLAGVIAWHGIYWCNNDTDSTLARQYVDWGKPAQDRRSRAVSCRSGGIGDRHFSRLYCKQKGTKALAETDGRHDHLTIVRRHLSVNLHTEQRNCTEINWHGLVFGELTSWQATPLDGAYCNALLLAHWSVCQKLNHVSSVQLRHSVHAFEEFLSFRLPTVLGKNCINFTFLLDLRRY